MKSVIIVTFLCSAIFSALVLAAPTETTTTPAPVDKPPTTTTPASPASTENEKTTTPSSAPTTEPVSANTITSSAVSSVGDFKPLNTSSFTCYGRSVGYYADLDTNCKVYHFCLPGEYNQEVVYQRISYLCLNESVFDQQALDCVPPSKLSAPCNDSATYYENSNNILRQAILGKPLQDQTASGVTPSSEAPQSSTAAPAS